MLNDGDLKDITCPNKRLYKNGYIQIKSKYVDEFINFLDNNHDWLNRVACLNNFIDY